MDREGLYVFTRVVNGYSVNRLTGPEGRTGPETDGPVNLRIIHYLADTTPILVGPCLLTIHSQQEMKQRRRRLKGATDLHLSLYTEAALPIHSLPLTFYGVCVRVFAGKAFNHHPLFHL